MDKHRKQGFTAAEMLITLSTIGLLCSTTLAVNSMDNSSCKIAETKALQTNEALNAWNRNFLKTDESGVGIAFDFATEDAMIKSLKDYVNVTKIQDSPEDEVFLNIEGYKFKNYKKLTLSNGTVLNIKYIFNSSGSMSFGGRNYTTNRFKSNYAYITVNVPHKNKSKITNVYVLKYNGLNDIGYIDSVCDL